MKDADSGAAIVRRTGLAPGMFPCMDNAACLDLVDLCYQAVEDPAAWQAFVLRLTRALDADAGDFVIEQYDRQTCAPLGSVGFDPGFRLDYDASFLGDNPWIGALKRLPLQRAFSNELEPENFEASAYFNEWVKPQGFRHALGGLVELDGRRAVHIGVLRNEGREAFRGVEARFFDRLFPHLQRALRFCDHLQAAGIAASAIDTLVGQLRVPAFLLAADTRLVGLNAAAEGVLATGGELSLRCGQLRLWESAAQHRLEAELARAGRFEEVAASTERNEIVLPRKADDGPSLLLDLMPLRNCGMPAGHAACCLALLIDPVARLPADGNALARLWGLTPTEITLAIAVTEGVPLAAFAEGTGTSVGTVRWHLKNIQTKIGVNSMVAVAARVQGALRRV